MPWPRWWTATSYVAHWSMANTAFKMNKQFSSKSDNIKSDQMASSEQWNRNNKSLNKIFLWECDCTTDPCQCPQVHSVSSWGKLMYPESHFLAEASLERVGSGWSDLEPRTAWMTPRPLRNAVRDKAVTCAWRERFCWDPSVAASVDPSSHMYM